MGCGDSIGSVEPPLLFDPPQELMIPCKYPVKIPEQDITQFETENYWGSDRRSLVICRSRNEALLEFYLNRDLLITGLE